MDAKSFGGTWCLHLKGSRVETVELTQENQKHVGKKILFGAQKVWHKWECIKITVSRDIVLVF
jgi:hypothetical protein